jgi:pimeloyl-ACP methyl ester carboxylesterase
MIKRLSLVTLLTMSILLAGCGDSADPLSTTAGGSLLSVIRPLNSAAGGTIAHPAGHSIDIPPNGVSGDTQATLTLLPQGLPQAPHPEFQSVGTAFSLNLGTQALITEATVNIPFNTGSPDQHRLYWLLPGNFYFPLQTTHNGGVFSAVLPQEVLTQVNAQTITAQQTHSVVTVGLMDESQYLSRPDHVDWPSYNLYVFQNGSFQKFVDQGQTVGTVPTLGNRPLMVVHGLGSDIPNFQSTAAALGPGGFTSIIGYEYDTLSGIATTGPRLRDAYNLVQGGQTPDWHHLAHSMGCVVSRQGFETGGPLSYNSNNVVFAAGPHLGSMVVNDLQGNNSTFEQFITSLVVNNLMEFSNADGTPCQVNITDAGFNDLAVGASALQTLNTGAAQNHPKETYRTLGGNDRGVAFTAVDAIIGTYMDDGFVDLSSANPGSAIGALESQSVPDNHLNITTDPAGGLTVILEYLGRT